MSCVTAFDKKHTAPKHFVLALALTMGFSGIVVDAAGAQQYPPQYQQAPGQPGPGGQAMPAGYQQGYPAPGPQNYAQQQLPGVQPGQVDRTQMIGQWFRSYDDIRRKAQMNPAERAKADGLMSKAISMFIPGEEKVQAQKLLTSLVARYSQAVDEMKRLPLYPETEKLHRGYYQYFTSARQLFGDYLAVQQNPLATDSTGTTIATTLLTRKQQLESLDQANKTIDGQLRTQFNIPPYQY
jgi:hypothetical protein